MSSVTAGLDQLLDEPRLSDLVALYFRSDGPFAGHLFDELGNNPEYEFAISDLLAVSLLDVAFGPAAVRALLNPPDTWTAMLEAASPAKPLWEAAPSALDAADSLWSELVILPGVGPTKAGKLLARKRPALIPIYDQVVATFLAPDEGRFWEQLAEALADGSRRAALDALVAELVPSVSTLRSLDVAIWMRCGESRNAVDARVTVGLAAEPLVRR